MGDWNDVDDTDNDFFTTNSELSDEDLMLHETRNKNCNYLEETVPEYSEADFFEHFRVSRHVATDIADTFKRSTFYNSTEGHYGNIPPLHQIFIYLWYIGHQTASFRDVADRFDVTISSLHRIIYRVTMFLSNLAPEIIKWPNEDEKRVIERNFRASGFPNVIGAMDGCHITLDKPKNDPDSYIDRNKNYSIQMQVVCDHQKKIIDLFVGYPGSVHDSRVFRNSPLAGILLQRCGRYYILADSGYPLKTNVLTPYKDRGNLTRKQQNYNRLLAKNRYVIEHCFGLLKQKFRQLYHIKLRNIPFIVHFIRTACVLHNIALYDNFTIQLREIPMNDNVQNDDDNVGDEEDDMNARIIRDNIANSLVV